MQSQSAGNRVTSVSVDSHAPSDPIAQVRKRRQRGQKRPKKEKLNGDVPQIPSDDKKAMDDDRIESQAAPASSIALSPKKPAKPARTRKDRYDPSELALFQIDRGHSATVLEPRKVISNTKVIGPIVKVHLSVREREVAQLKRRYGNKLRIEGNRYEMPFVPTDPDFPYDLPELILSIKIPDEYPKAAMSLVIKSGLETGFSRNIERAFDTNVATGHGGRGILGSLTWLDRNLEALLALKKSETFKIVRSHSIVPSTVLQQQSNIRANLEMPEITQSAPTIAHSQESLAEAAITRNMELSRLRMIHPSQMQSESFDLQLSPLLFVRLFVPSTYPLDTAHLAILQGPREIENAANREIKAGSRGLARDLNWIVSNVKKLQEQARQESHNQSHESLPPLVSKAKAPWTPADDRYDDNFVLVEGHIYSMPKDDSVSDSEDYSSGDDQAFSDLASDLEDLEMSEHRGESIDLPSTRATISDQVKESGTAINTVINLVHIALLEPITISLTLKCLRCKSTGNDIPTIQPSGSASTKCPTCSTILSVHYRGLALHAHNSRMGYIDLTGCSVLDLGPSSFSPTCEKCGDIGPAIKGLVAGQPQTRPCRACHIKQSISITTTSFLIINHASTSSNIGSRTAQNLGLVRGQPLPDTGVCKHYRKSHRWFRFPCCQKVYACDLCHDSLSTPRHSTDGQLAKTQICGWCSKESPVRGVKPCVFCGRDMTRRSGGGFWEGGRGTRDQKKMNRGDKRKYRRNLAGSGSTTKGPARTKKKDRGVEGA